MRTPLVSAACISPRGKYGEYLRRVFDFEIEAAGHPGGTARRSVGAGAPAHPPGEFLILPSRGASQAWKISGRRLKREKHGASEARKLIGGKIIEL